MDIYTFQNLNGASSEKGGALIYILIAIALLAALTTTFIQPGGQSSRTQNAFKLASELTSQSRVIRSGIQDCILRYPQGHNAISETGYVDPYPLNPDSADTEYAAYDVTNKNVSNVRCPGAAFEIIFGGSGLFTSYLPPAPTLMEEWQYFNGNATGASQIYGMDFNGVFYEVKSDKSDPFIAESMQKVDGLMSSCEVDYTVGDGTNGCENGHQCLRFWIIRKSGGPAC
jgi:hypothetical protein